MTSFLLKILKFAAAFLTIKLDALKAQYEPESNFCFFYASRDFDKTMCIGPKYPKIYSHGHCHFIRKGDSLDMVNWMADMNPDLEHFHFYASFYKEYMKTACLYVRNPIHTTESKGT